MTKSLDIKALSRNEASLQGMTAGIRQCAEYSLQAQFCFMLPSLCSLVSAELPKAYEVQVEARADECSERLDILLLNHGLARVGFELCSAATQSIFTEHIQRASVYARVHNAYVNAVDFRVTDEPSMKTAPPLRFQSTRHMVSIFMAA